MASWQYVVALMLVITTTVFALDCEFGGSTYADGSSTTIDDSGPCVTYSCNNGAFAPSKVQCQAADNSCKNPGDVFPYVIKGKTWDNCGCTISDQNEIDYQCK